MSNKEDDIQWCLVRLGYEKIITSKIILQQGVTTLGRSLNSTVQIHSDYCSRNHCSISCKGDVLMLRDFNTSNGTYINNEKIQNNDYLLNEDDLIGIGVVVPLSELGKNNPEYYVYSVQKYIETIVLCSDDEDENKISTVPVNNAAQTANNVAETAADNVNNIDNDEDNDAIELSQYNYENQRQQQEELDSCLDIFNIKQEIIGETFEGIDFNRCELDNTGLDSDDDCNQQKCNDWSNQLSPIVIDSDDDDDYVYQSTYIKQEIFDKDLNVESFHQGEPTLTQQLNDIVGTSSDADDLFKLLNIFNYLKPSVDNNCPTIPQKSPDSTSMLINDASTSALVESESNVFKVPLKKSDGESASSKKRKKPLDEDDIHDHNRVKIKKHSSTTHKNHDNHSKDKKSNNNERSSSDHYHKRHHKNNDTHERHHHKNDNHSKDKMSNDNDRSSSGHYHKRHHKNNDTHERHHHKNETDDIKTSTKNSSLTTMPSSSSSHKSHHSYDSRRTVELIEPQSLKPQHHSSHNRSKSKRSSSSHNKKESKSSSKQNVTKNANENVDKTLKPKERMNNVKTKVTWRNRGAFLVENDNNPKDTPTTSTSIKTSSTVTSKNGDSIAEFVPPSINANLESIVEKDLNLKINPNSRKINDQPTGSSSSNYSKPTKNQHSNNKIIDPRSTIKNYCKSNNHVQSALEPVSFQRQLYNIRYNAPKTNSTKSTATTVNTVVQCNNNLNSIYCPLMDPATYDLLIHFTDFDPNWLDADATPPINGDEVLCPMVTGDYSTIQHFQKTLVPLMKLEFWEKVKYDYSKNKSRGNYDINIKSSKYVKGNGNKWKYVFECEAKSLSIKVWEFVIISYGSERNVHEFLGYIADTTYSRDMSLFTIEAASNKSTKFINSNSKNIKIFQFSHLKSEIATFNVIHTLKKSPLLDNILHPLLNSIKVTDCAPIIRYVGYDILNELQMKCLTKVYRRCLQSDDSNITLIDGPPGTGKSRLITNLILQLLYGKEITKRKRILICAQSNTAVDVIAKKLANIRSKMNRVSPNTDKDIRFKLVRFGVTERVDPMVRGFTVDSYAKTMNLEKIELLKKDKGMLSLKIKALKLTETKDSYEANELENYEMRLKNLDNDIGQLSRASDLMQNQIIRGAHIIATTLSSCNNLIRYIGHVDVCIIDEATQCCEPLSLIPLQFGVTSLVLVGDTKQLPATVLSQKCKNSNYSQSLFARIQNSFDKNATNIPVLQLTQQYRMHPEICSWPNEYFYSNRLGSDISTYDAPSPFLPYTIFSLDYDQNSDFDLSNNKEATFLTGLLKSMATYTTRIKKNYSYSVLTPYARQQQLIYSKMQNDELLKRIPVKTIDSSQGQEDDVILISIGRTIGSGFLISPQRVNVAMTRAKKCLILFCNFKAVKNVKVWELLLANAEKRKRVYHIHDEPQNYNEILNSILTPNTPI